MTRIRVQLAAVLVLSTLLSCKGANNQAEEPQALAQANASVENSVSAENMASEPTSGSDFIVFDGMRSRNKPAAEVAEAGLVPIEIVYAGQLFDLPGRPLQLQEERPMDLPDREVISTIARRISREGNRVAIINIEHWPLRGDTFQRSLENYVTVLEWFQEAAPRVEWGYYGLVPTRNDERALLPDSNPLHRRWAERTVRLRPLASSVDALFPSLYAKNDDRDRWVRSAERHIIEARRANPNVPIYVFLWPQYSDGSRRPIEPDFWRLQLETARARADGVVIWHTARHTWVPNAPWWEETKEFMRTLQ